MTNLTDIQKAALQKLLRRRSIMPHEVCIMLHVQRSAAIAILESLMQQYPETITRKTLIYCNCEVDNTPPCAAIPCGKAMPDIIKCSLCDEQIEIDDSIGIDQIFLLKSAINLGETP